MAKPPSDITNSTSLNSGSSYGRRSSGVRKRTRDSELLDDVIAYPSKHAKYTEDTYKTRRVNPERLALRLDPKLVAEMDVLITPGAKMPTFAIRKDLQERYKVDRRHIYDYFHSRGLRVAKEDKHNNLTWALSLNARKVPVEPKTEQHEECVKRGEDKTEDAQEVTDGGSGRSNPATPSQLPQELGVRSAKRLASAKISAGTGRRTNCRSQILGKTRRRTGFSEVLPSSGAEDENNRHQSYNPPVSPVPDFTFPEEIPDTPMLDEDPMSDSLSEHLPDFPDLDLDLDLWNDYGVYLPSERGEMDPVVSVDEHRSLTEEERIEFYNLIDKSISPPNGVEQCSGTYSAYMKERSRFYSDRLFSKNSQGQSNLYQPDMENRQPDITPGEAGDFRKWLSNSASQHFIRTVAHFQTEDIKQYAVLNQLRDQTSGSL